MKTIILKSFRILSFPISQAQARFFSQVKEAFLISMLLSLILGLVLYKILLLSSLTDLPTFWSFYGLIATVFLITRIPYAYLHNDDHDVQYPSDKYPSVSIIIAAKNEEDNIYRTISTCLESVYEGAIELLIIDDGSTDNTNSEIRRAQSYYGERIRLFTFEQNQGKREAMAVGIRESKNEIIVFVDSDSFLAPDAIHHIVEHFIADEKIGAVAGNTKVENINANLLTRMQSIQYAVSFDVYKASESVHQSVTCCPGCFSAYRADAIRPFVYSWKDQKFFGSKATFGDDRGLTNFVLKNWNIVYCQKARASTNVPEKFRVYWKQQLRWKKSWIREGLFAGLFMWKKVHPLASFAFYTNFTFPIAGPILAASVLYFSIRAQNPLLVLVFSSGFIVLGLVFALFVRINHKAENWYVMPLMSFLFVTVFMWQMPYALLTLRKTHWGTR